MRIDRRWTRLDSRAAALALALAASVTAACGGGALIASASPRPVATSGTKPAAAASDMVTCGLPHFQAAALARINRARAMGADCRSGGRFGPARPLAWNDSLAAAAAQHSRDMSKHDFFSHTGSDGRDVPQRATAAGYAWASIGENIEAGQASIDEAVAGWMESDHHCANIMAPSFTEMALACVAGGPGNTYTTYWTLDLGRRR